MADDPDKLIIASSRVPFDPVDLNDRAHLTLTDQTRQLPYNRTIPRFDPEQWVVDYNALMVATILPIGIRSFKVPAQWRTNSDFLGVRWISEDTYNHHFFKYKTEKDFSGSILAFRHNAADPMKFTVTLTSNGAPQTYRLAPYYLNPETNRWENLDTDYGTKNSYPAEQIRAPEYTIPLDEIVECKGRKDYIFILDYGDLRTLSSYTGPRIDPTNISMLSFDCVEASHGLGKDAFVASMVQHAPGEIEMEVGKVYTNAVLSAGDKLQLIWRYYDPATMIENFREDEFIVKRYTGFGSGNLTVIVEGTMPGIFAGCDAFYGRYLAVGVPSGVTDSTKYFCDFTLTGGKLRIDKRHYPQNPNGMGMTSGFDDGYNLTPERQVKMTYDLGYRDRWTTYIGMSHYFSGRTAFLDKVTGEKVVESDVLEFPVLFAGEGNASVHFKVGKFPNRGMDAYTRVLTEQFGVSYSAIDLVDGAVGSTAADRMCSPNPASDVFDPGQTKLGGGLWWWNLETNQPGPALLNCIEMMEDRVPRAVMWSQGQQDASAIAFPGTRNPVPSVARTKLATAKTFEYMRSVWGANLPILIQELGYGWGVPNPARPEIPIMMGQPTYLDAKRNSWGDVVFTWLSYGDAPNAYTYRVDIYNPLFPTQIMRSLEVPGTQIDDRGLIFCDYACEDNVSDAISVYGDQFPWDFLRWRVVRTDNPLVQSQPTETLIEEDNNAFVKKVIGCGINSLIGGYFNDLSDPLNHGGTGRPGRKDVIAASTFRKRFAQGAGLRPCQVMPVMLVIGSSPINPMPYQPGFPLTNYWWDAPSNGPGPNLVIANNIVQTLGRPLDYFIESGPGETTGIAFAPKEDWPAILAAWKSSNIAMLNWMRVHWGNPTLEIWFQGASTSWWGVSAPPTEVNWEGAHVLRQTQTEMAQTTPGFKMGSYVPNGGSWHAYLNEMADGLGWVHYSLDAYHACADEMGDNMSANRNIALLPPPLWTTLLPPSNLRARKQVNNAVLFTWDGRPEASVYQARNFHAQDMSLIQQEDVTQKRWIFSVESQIQVYNQLTSYVIFDTGEYIAEGAVEGPKGRYEDFALEGDPSFPALTGLTATYVGPAVEVPGSGGTNYPRDILFAWTGPADGRTHWIKNFRADVAQVTVNSLEVAGNSFVFTVADQQAAYGSGAGYVIFDVAKYDPADQVRGPIMNFTGTPAEPI